MAKVTIKVEMEDGTVFETTCDPFDRVMNQVIAAASMNGSRNGSVEPCLQDVVYSGINAVLDSTFKARWEGFGPNRETIYERNVLSAPNDPHYAFYDTADGRKWLSQNELGPMLQKLRV
jgi:hypothetical protein